MAIGRRRHKNQGQKRESPSNLQFMLLCENSLFHQRLFSHCLAPLCVMPHSNKEGCSEGKSLLGRENKGAHSSLLVIIFPLIDRDFYNQLTICGDKVIIGKVLEQAFFFTVGKKTEAKKLRILKKLRVIPAKKLRLSEALCNVPGPKN